MESSITTSHPSPLEPTASNTTSAITKSPDNTPTVFEPINDGFEVLSYIKSENGYANLTAYTIDNKSGAIEPVRFKIKAVGTVGDSCILSIDDSKLLTADPIPSEINHTIKNGIIEIEKNESGSGSSGGNGYSPITNTPPICNISLNEIIDFTGSLVNFDGSASYDPDGMIVSYEWDFNDGNTSSGMVVSHQFSETGRYEVMLTVEDDDGAFSIDMVEVIITESDNYPPSKSVINGPSEGNKDVVYEFSFNSFDEDGDDIRYMVDWSDGKSSSSLFDAENVSIILNHSWSSAGKFIIKVNAYDNKTESFTGTHMILIDAVELVFEGIVIGVLSDVDGDGIYDLLDDKEDTVSYSETEEMYLFDTNGDGIWDYEYDLVSGMVIMHMTDNTESEFDTGMILMIGIIVVILVLFIGGAMIYRFKKD